MSTTTTTPDTPTSAGDGDIKAGMGRLLHETQTKTYFPIGAHEEKDQDQKTAASQRLTYTVSGHLTARLSTDWEIVPGFKLTSVELSVDVYYGSESINRFLSASLTANTRVAGCLLSVKGEIPDLRNDEPTEFTLSLAVLYAGRRTTPEDVAGALIGMGSSSGLGTMVGRLDSDVAGALRDPAAMAGALFARMTVLHDGDSYFVKEVGVSVAARFEWAPVEAIRITDVELYLGASRSGADSEWEYAARVSGKMSIGAAVATVVAKLDVGGDGGDSSAAGSTTSAEVAVRVGEYRGVSAKDLIRTVVGEEPGSVFGEMPEGIPDAEHCFSGTSAAGEVVVEIEKGAAVAGSGWGIKSVVVRAELLDFVWKVVDGLEVQDVAFALKVERGAVTAAGVGAAGAGTVTEGSISGTENKKWVFKGPMGVTLSLQRAQFVMPVSISYGSHKDIVDIEGTLPDGGYGQMTALAADPAILALPESEGGA